MRETTEIQHSVLVRGIDGDGDVPWLTHDELRAIRDYVATY